MNRLLILVFSLCASVFLLGLATSKTKKKPPPGTVLLADNLFIDKTPISNQDYRQFEYFLKHVGFDCYKSHINKLSMDEKFDNNVFTKKLHEQCKPDSAQFKTVELDENIILSWMTDSNDITLGYYYRHPAYDPYPVIHVTYEQAKKYCEWRTYAVRHGILLKNQKQRKKHYKKVKYRLPTQKEWETALEKFKDDIYFADKKGTSYCFINRVDFKKDKYKYYLSNISEMVYERGVAKGRNWKSEVDDPNLTVNYETNTDWLGFRCVCEIVEE